MNKPKLILKGKVIFITAILTTALTTLIIHITGLEVNRPLGSNLFLSLGIISIVLFLFLTITLFKGTKLINDYPKFKSYEIGTIMQSPELPDIGLDVGEGPGGIILSIILWVAMAVLLVLLVIFFEAIVWMSVFVLFAAIYWVFIRALRLVYYKGRKAQGDFKASIFIALIYTLLYSGWLYGIALIAKVNF